MLALGLGLGLSTTMFAVLDAVVNPYLPYRDPDTLFRVRWWYSVRDVQVGPGVLYNAVHDQMRSFAAVIPFGGARKALEEDEGREAFTTMVSPQFFEVTGVRPRLGRGFTQSDGEDVVVVSDALWRRLFGRRTSLGGATLTLSDRVYTIVGVMPRAAIAPGYTSIWMPYPANVNPANSAWMPLVRLKAGVTKAQAEQELHAVEAAMTQQFASRDRPIHFEIVPVRERREELRDIHKAMLGSAVGVLLIACVNLAHLMLARGLSKRRELALRLALGAGRSAVVWQMFAECVIVTIGGATLGALGALWGADILTNRVPPEVSWIGAVQPQLSWRVFAASAGLAALSAVLFGLLPATRVAFALSLDEPLKDGAGTTGRARQRYSPLVVVEVALALVLMMGGGLLLRTIQQIRGMQFTFDATTLLSTQVGYRGGDDTVRIRRSDLLAAVTSVPGVRDAAWRGGRVALGGAMTGEMIGGDSTRTISGGPTTVSWNYLRVFGLPVIKGRDFEPGDGVGDGVAILTAGAAQRLYPNRDAVGHMVKLGAPARDAPWVRIIGVARSPIEVGGNPQVSAGGLTVFVVEGDGRAQFGSILIRTERTDPRIATEVRRKLRTMPRMWYSSVESYAASRDSELASRGFLAKVFVSMGLVALGLSALGLYGVLAYAVNQRMREFAVRIALGAAPRQLFRMVLHDGFVMLLAGVGIGAFGALVAGRLLDAVLTTVLPSDVISLVACEIVLFAVGFAAALGPARRAVRANPLDILRSV